VASLNDLFHALSDPTRREILHLLRLRDMTAGELAEAFPLAASTMSGHFRVLKHAGLVVAERQATRIVYSLNLSAVEEAVAVVLDLVGAGKPRKGAKP
jgi:ArsR family transcriptional regulator, arsenate/arsenite/antimonite-responsive transcriptional repressor